MEGLYVGVKLNALREDLDALFPSVLDRAFKGV